MSDYAQLTGGRYLANLWQTDSIQAAFLTKIIRSVNTVAANAGVGAVGDSTPPPPVNAVNVTAAGEQMQISLTHNAQITRPIKYFSEIDTDPNFPNALVVDHGSSRSPTPFSLPTKDASGAAYSYYVRSYAQYPGSAPSAPTTFGGSLAPAAITLGGQTEMDLLSSTGSGTASSSGQQGASGAGKSFASTPAVGQSQASFGGISQAAAVVASGTVGALVLPGIFTVSGSSPITADPAGGDIDIAFTAETANLIFAGPSSGSAAVPTFRAMVAADEPSTTVNSITDDTNVTGVITSQDLALGWAGTLSVARGGTGTDSPGLVEGTDITISGSWPNQTISFSGSLPTPGGSTTDIQYNNSGAFGGSDVFQLDVSSLLFLINGLGSSLAIGEIQTGYFGFSAFGTQFFLTGESDANLYIKAQAGGSVFLQPNQAALNFQFDGSGNISIPTAVIVDGNTGATAGPYTIITSITVQGGIITAISGS